MAVPFHKSAFTAGEVTPGLFGRIDLAKFSVAASTMRNMFVSYRGGCYSRAGTKFVGYSKQTGRSFPPRLITFQFNINQGIAIEFGNFYARFISSGGFITEAAKNITGATQANPCVLTVAAHGYSNGDWVFVSGVGGMTQLNGQTFVVAGATTNTFQLNDVFGNAINSTFFGAYTGGGTAARVYTIVSPYAEADLAYLKFTQSADVMSICCWNQATGQLYPPQDLKRLGNTNWTIATPTFAPTISPPTALSGTASTSGTTDYNYVVTAVNPVDGTESVASNIADISSAVDIAATAGTITLTWTPPTPVSGPSGVFNVYKAPPNPTSGGTVPVGSLFGYIGTVYGTQFVDTNIVADFAQVPPLHMNPFAPGQILGVAIITPGSSITGGITPHITTVVGSGAVVEPIVVGGVLVAVIVIDPGQFYEPGDFITFTVGGGTAPTASLVFGPETGTYPSTVSYFQERRVYAGTPNNPDTYFMSQPGAFTNFDARVPSNPSDAITGTPWSVQVDGIQFMVSMPGGLVVLTGLSAWQLTGVGGSSLNPQPITPSSQQAQPQAYNGCSATVPPIRNDYDILYVQAKGSIVRDLAYNYWVNIYTGSDLTQLSSHLFTGYTISQWAWCEEPLKIVWTVRNDGTMLSLTYLKPQEVAGWARHDTMGLFVSVCAVTEPPVDALYTATQRFIGGNSPYMIERMDNRIWSSVEQCWCVDAGLQLPMPTPNATLTANSATGLGSITGIVPGSLVGGKGYSALTTAVVVDANGQGPGTGAVPTLTIVSGVITNIVFAGGNQGGAYIFPAIQFNDPGGGSGASASLVLNNNAEFTASAAVFNGNASDVGNVIRMGGGIAVITAPIDTQHVTANIISPIVATISDPSPGASPTVIPQTAGSWTLTTPTTAVSGLNHLAGTVVTGLADGNVIPPTLVSQGGMIALNTPASAITVGLPFHCRLQSVYLDTGNPTIQGQRKKISAVSVLVENSRDIQVTMNQPDGSILSPMQISPTWQGFQNAPNGGNAPMQAQKKPYNALAQPLFTGYTRVPLSGGISINGQVAAHQDSPLPLQVLAFVPEVDAGDTPQPPGPAKAPPERPGREARAA